MAAPGAVLTALMVTPELELGEDEKCPASPPTRAATSKSESRVDHRVRLFFICEESGASSAKLELAPRVEASDSAPDSDDTAATGVGHDIGGASLNDSETEEEGVAASSMSGTSGVELEKFSSGASVGMSLTPPCYATKFKLGLKPIEMFTYPRATRLEPYVSSH